jgi:hypothetical protein
MSSKKDTKLLFEGWRKFLSEAQKEEVKSEAEEKAESPESSDKKIIRIYDFDNTLVKKIGIDPQEVLEYVRERTEEKDGKYNLSTDPNKPSPPRSAAQITTADIGYYSMFFTIKSETLPLFKDFELHKNSEDTYILSKFTIPEQIDLNKDNLIYQWFEEKFGGSEKEDTEAKTVGQKRRKAIAQKLHIPREQVVLAKKKDVGIKTILDKYKPEDIAQVLIYDNSQDDINDMLPTAKRMIGADKVSATKV